MVSAPTHEAPDNTSLTNLCNSVATLQQLLEKRLDRLENLLTGQRKENLTVEEVAGMTGRSEYTVRRWISEGRLKAIRLMAGGPRGRLLVQRNELELLIAAGKGGSVPATALG